MEILGEEYTCRTVTGVKRPLLGTTFLGINKNVRNLNLPSKHPCRPKLLIVLNAHGCLPAWDIMVYMLVLEDRYIHVKSYTRVQGTIINFDWFVYYNSACA